MITTRKVPMVDLVGQYEKIKTEVDQNIQEVINSAIFINGPSVKEFSNSTRKIPSCKTRYSLRKRNRRFANCNDGA